jgi:hypothetical protein
MVLPAFNPVNITLFAGTFAVVAICASALAVSACVHSTNGFEKLTVISMVKESIGVGKGAGLGEGVGVGEGLGVGVGVSGLGPGPGPGVGVGVSGVGVSGVGVSGVGVSGVFEGGGRTVGAGIGPGVGVGVGIGTVSEKIVPLSDAPPNCVEP